MSRILTGECLCGSVKFKLEDDFKAFYQCHCKQCQQLTGSAFAANLFTAPENIEWLSGQANILSYEHENREFSKSLSDKQSLIAKEGCCISDNLVIIYIVSNSVQDAHCLS